LKGIKIGRGMSGGDFSLGDLGDSDFWKGIKIGRGSSGGAQDFTMGDLADPNFWKSISIGRGLHTPHRSGGFELGDLGDSDFWKGIKISRGSGSSGGMKFKLMPKMGMGDSQLSDIGNYMKDKRMSGGDFTLGDLGDKDFWKGIKIGRGMSGGDFWEDFKTGFNMSFEPGAKYILKPLFAATGGLPLAAGLEALGYGSSGGKHLNGGKEFELEDLADPSWWAKISLKRGSGKHYKMKMKGGDFTLGDLANKDFWNSIKIGRGMSGGDFFSDLVNPDTYKNLARQVVGVADKGVEGLNQTYSSAKNTIGLGMKTAEYHPILADRKAEAKEEKEMKASGFPTGPVRDRRVEPKEIGLGAGKLSLEDKKIISAVKRKMKGKGKKMTYTELEQQQPQKPLIELKKGLPPKANLPSSSMGSGASGGKKGLPPALQKWQAHLKAFRSSHPNLSLKECMQQAKHTYKK